MTKLPREFTERMKRMLPEEYEDFLASYESPRMSGLRVNLLKTTPEELEPYLPEGCKRIPFVDHGFFVPEGVRMGASPLYAAGVFYLQEPSAMTPASRLPVVPGDRVLDLCAAPGGKATELAACLKGKGILVANDISNARAKALLRNLELSGCRNALVTQEAPDRLASVFPEYFDKILVDAPCSGEGMFRKDEDVIGTWTPDRPAWFAERQKGILKQAVRMLKPGGLLMYSTCTFSPEEDEGSVSFLLREFPQMHTIEMASYEGFERGKPEWADGNPELLRCIRIWPHKMNGEGHFLALLQKEGGPQENRLQTEKKEKRTGKDRKRGQKAALVTCSGEEKKQIESFLSGMETGFSADQLEVRGGRVYLSPEVPEGVRNLHFLRNGLFVGELKKARFEPSEPLALTLRAEDVPDCLNLALGDERLEQYLHGEAIPVKEGETKSSDGWKLVAAAGFGLGWGKMVQGVLKNKLPSGWRR